MENTTENETNNNPKTIKIVTDNIRETDEIDPDSDQLGYNRLSEYFLDYIESKGWPISVGVYGKWGSGKSVFVKLLRDHALKKKIGVVYVDAISFRNSSKDTLIKEIVGQNHFSYKYFVIPLSIIGILLVVLAGVSFAENWEFIAQILFSTVATGYVVFVFRKFLGLLRKSFLRSIFFDKNIAYILD